MTMRRISSSRLARLKSEGRGLNGTFKRPTINEVITAQQARDKEVREAIRANLKDTPVGAMVRASVKDQRNKAKAAAWKWFSMFIRLRDSDAYGRAQCVTCQRSDHWRTMDAGHFITRAKEATLFDERNVSCQCKGCNRFQGGRFFEHEQAIERKFGAGTAQTLKDKAGQVCKRTTSDYQFIADTYKKRVELIRANEPNKLERA